jgi:SAM-dependent methyltransferase
MTITSLTTAPPPAPPPTWQLLYSPWAWRRWIAATSERIKRAHTEANFRAVEGEIAAGASVLDVGAWDGRLGRELAARRGCAVTLVDVVDKNETALPLRRFDGTTLPVHGDERFDVVTLLYVLHHAADDAALLREARRVVATGGKVLVGEDLVESFGQRCLTVGFHLWLLACTLMGWRGHFRRLAAWRARFAAAGLIVEREVMLGAQGRLFPRNVLFVLQPGPVATSSG